MIEAMVNTKQLELDFSDEVTRSTDLQSYIGKIIRFDPGNGDGIQVGEVTGVTGNCLDVVAGGYPYGVRVHQIISLEQ